MAYHRYAEPQRPQSAWADDLQTGIRLNARQARNIIRRRLEQLPGGAMLSEATMGQLARSIAAHRFGAGEIIIKKGVHGDFMAVVARGQVAVHSSSAEDASPVPGGYDQAVVMPVGSTFGEAMLIYGHPAGSTVRAVGDTRLYILRRADFLPVLKQRRPRTGVNLHVPLHAGVRLLSAVVLMIALVFFLALLMELGREGDLRMIPSAFPAATQFTGEYLQNLTHGDLGTVASRFGRSEGRPVLEELADALPKSLGLLAVSLLLAAMVGLYLGMVAALRRKSPLSGLILFASAFGVSTPSYFAAMLLIWLGVWLYQRTGQHFWPLAGFGWDEHLLLPALVLAARPAAAVTRLSYNALAEILDADYVRTARSKGLRPRVVLLEHVLRNAGVPILTTVVVSLRFSLAILPIVEYIFSWPGIGQALLTAIQAQDVNAVVGMVLPLALLFVLVNWVAELLYLRLDPRLRNSTAGAA